jgi:predicted transcriptional regulator
MTMRKIETMSDLEILEQSKATIELLKQRLSVLEATNKQLLDQTQWLWGRLEVFYDRISSLLDKEIRQSK